MMTQTAQALDPHKHQTLRRRMDIGYGHARQSCFAPVVPGELDHVVASFPVVFVKDSETGRFSTVALFGLAEGENFFVAENGSWMATYAPTALDVHPFSLGVAESGEHLLCVFDEAEACSKSTGERIFQDDGTATPFLTSIQGKLNTLLAGEKIATGYIEELLRCQVLKELAILTAHQSGKTHRLQEIYTVDKEQISALSDEKILELHKSGALGFATLCASSLAQITTLVQRKNMISNDPIIKIEATTPVR